MPSHQKLEKKKKGAFLETEKNQHPVDAHLYPIHI